MRLLSSGFPEMTAADRGAFSRPVKAVRGLRDQAGQLDFVNARVLLTGEAKVLQTQNGQWIAEDALRVLIRTYARLHVYLPPGCADFGKRLRQIASLIQFAEPVCFLDEEPDFESFGAILSVGCQAREGLPWTVVNSNGWLARVSSTICGLQGDYNQPNPLGALAAASLGASDVFKRTVQIEPKRADLFDALTFSTYDFTVGGRGPGPALATELAISPTLFAGQGAIGSAICLLVGQLPLHGRAMLLDRDAFEHPNLGTSVLLGPDGEQASKAHWNAEHLKAQGSRLDVDPQRAKIELAENLVAPYLGMVVAGFDKIEPRHALQRLWPETIIDGAVGDFTVQFLAYDHGKGFACLKCHFQASDGGDPIVIQSRLTGLSVEALKNNREVTKADVEGAPIDKREVLEINLGRPACSVAAELSAISTLAMEDDFAPSVPFVATMSAVLVVGELVRRAMGIRSDCRRFKFDVLLGPHYGRKVNEPASAGCECQTRRHVIDAVRRARGAAL